MPDDAGFAAALTIREGTLSDALLLAYANDDFPRGIDAPLIEGPPDAKLTVFFGPPALTCRADDTLAIDLDLWGWLSVTVSAAPLVRLVRGHLEVRIRPVVAVADGKVKLNPAAEDVTVPGWDFTVLFGPGFPPDVDAYLHGGLFRNRLQATIRAAIDAGAITWPDIDLAVIGPLAGAVDMSAAARARAGALMIGLDVIGYDTGSEVLTITGDPNALVDFARGYDMAAVTNAAAVPIVLQQAQDAVRAEVAKSGATLQGELEITPQNGRFRIAGTASKSTGSATFSFALVPELFASRPGGAVNYIDKPFVIHPRTWPALSFSTADVHVNVDPSPWVIVLAAVGTALNLGIPLIVVDMIRSTAAHLQTSIAGQDPSKPVARVQRFPPAKPDGAAVRIELAAYEITTDGIYTGVTIRPEPPPAALIGPTSIPADLRTSTLRYRIRLPLGLRPDDPLLRIRWTVVDLASGTVLRSDDAAAAGRQTFAFVPATVGPGLSRLGVDCRVYRTLGPDTTDFVNEGIRLDIRGALPQGAYVRWRYEVKNPQVLFDDPTRAWAYRGDEIVKRHSNLHSTEFPCANAQRISRYAGEIERLDALPFAVGDIELHRSELCDYCFYGGPAGLQPAL
jgi:hypothetical protein